MTEEIGGGVPIEKDILPTEREFFPTYYEHLFKGAKQIIKDDILIGGGTSTMYTVPLNHELYISSAHLSAESTGVKIASINLSDGVVLLRTYVFTNSAQNMSISYPIPLKIEENTVITLRGTDASIDCLGGFTGFLVKKPLI